MIGQIIGNRYLVKAELGRGGFGVVYLALDSELENRECVIKMMMIPPNSSQQDIQSLQYTFRREAKALIELNTPGHPAIPEIYRIFTDAMGNNYLVMKYITGKSLESHLADAGGKLSWRVAAKIALDVADGLAYMHNQSPPVLHRDIKPANILIDTQDRTWMVDFGLSKAQPTVSGTIGMTEPMGTPGYAPPEQYQTGGAVPRSDVYALGVLVYHLVTGDDPADHPFNFPKIDQLPQELRPHVTQALEQNPTKRPASDQFRDTLRKVLATADLPKQTPPPQPPPVQPPPPPAPVQKKHKKSAKPRIVTVRGAFSLIDYTLYSSLGLALVAPLFSFGFYAFNSGDGGFGASILFGLAGGLVGVVVAIVAFSEEKQRGCCIGTILGVVAGFALGFSTFGNAKWLLDGTLVVIGLIGGGILGFVRQLSRLRNEGRGAHWGLAGLPSAALIGLILFVLFGYGGNIEEAPSSIFDVISTEVAIGEERPFAPTSSPTATRPRTSDSTSPYDRLSKGKVVHTSTNGSLPHKKGDGNLVERQATGSHKNFVAEAVFVNPYEAEAADGAFNYGFLFRNVGRNQQFRLVVFSNGRWQLIDRQGSNNEVIQNGKLEAFNTADGASNRLTLVAEDNIGQFFLNTHRVAELDLSARNDSGGLFVFTGMNNQEITGRSTAFREFTVWSLP